LQKLINKLQGLIKENTKEAKHNLVDIDSNMDASQTRS